MHKFDKCKRQKTYATMPCLTAGRGMLSCVCLSFFAVFFFILAGASEVRFVPREDSTTWSPVSAQVGDVG